jgi:DNA-directed RNA polymerase specialized sigma24 family protein
MSSVAACDTTGAVAPLGSASFKTTRWSVVVAAGDQLSPGSAKALGVLCQAYWYPLYAYVRRRGLAVVDAQDVTQEFFHRLIAKNYLGSVDRRKGSFRAFLLAAMNHLLSNEWDKARALKRGGGNQIVSLDLEEAEGRFVQEPAQLDSAEALFDRRWALTLLDRALGKLREEFADAENLPQFEVLKVFLSDVAGEGDYAGAGELLGMDAGRVAVAVHRMRVRYREIVRTEIAQTVNNEEELKAEMRHLLACLS